MDESTSLGYLSDCFTLLQIFSQSMKKAVQLVLCTVVSNVREAKKIAADILEDLLNNQERRAFILKYDIFIVEAYLCLPGLSFFFFFFYASFFL